MAPKTNRDLSLGGIRTRPYARWLLVTLLSGSAAVSTSHPVAAAGDKERVAYMNKKAMEDYDALEFESARKTLTDCVALLRKTGLDSGIQAARTYINLGMVYIALKDKYRGQQQFVKAIQINPNAKLDPALATPDMQAIFDAARAQSTGQPPPAPAPVDNTPPPVAVQQPAPAPTPDPILPTPPPVAVQQPTPNKGTPTGLEYSADELLNPVKKVDLKHTPYEEVPAGQKFSLYVHPTPVHAGGAVSRATLFYRGQGQERYTEVPMAPSRAQQGDLVGTVPAEAASGRTLQYYIEAYDAQNRVCGNQGTADNPFIVRLSARSGVVAVPAEDVEDPLKYVKREDERQRLKAIRDYVYIDIGVGTGGAVIGANSNTEVAWFFNRSNGRYEQARSSSAGFVWSGVGLKAEVGAYLWRGLSLGVSGRVEVYLNHNADSNANTTTQPCTDSMGRMSPCFATTSRGNFGYMVLGKLRYQFRQGTTFRPHLHVDVGGGEWRGALNIDGSRPRVGDQVDNSSQYQPTDVCSAQYNGKTDASRDPPGCSSIAGNSGYNRQADAASATQTLSKINRVCPAVGPCVDSVQMNKVFVGGGFGFYAGSRHVGISTDVNLTAAVGGQFGLIIDAYIGPQFIF